MSRSLFYEITAKRILSERFTLDATLQSSARAIALAGPSGCGKTSLLHVIAGVLPAPQSTIRIGGRIFQRGNNRLSRADRRVGLVVQEGLLFPLLNVLENLHFGRARAQGNIPVNAVIDLLEIGHLLNRKTRNLSGGERQRVALGRALLSEPDLLLLDEPFAPLDVPRRERLIRMLNHIRKSWDVPMVLVSHDERDIASLVDEVFTMNGGRITGRRQIERSDTPGQVS